MDELLVSAAFGASKGVMSCVSLVKRRWIPVLFRAKDT